MVKIVRTVGQLAAELVAEGSKIAVGPVPWGRGFRAELRTEDDRLVAIVGPYHTYDAAKYALSEYCLTVRQ